MTEHLTSQVQTTIDSLLERKNQVLVAIDGNCTAGKTTLAAALAELYDCNVFHMDDFFLRSEQRTEDRYAQIGGNVDYERFREEVLIPLQSEKSFSYRPFQCKTFTMGDAVTVTPKQLNIIEGTYSLHPYFGEPYDLKVFLSIDAETQRQRILQRPAFVHGPFFEKWIPMEQAYFDGFQIREQCDLCLS